jgi:hypothetical protein
VLPPLLVFFRPGCTGILRVQRRCCRKHNAAGQEWQGKVKQSSCFPPLIDSGFWLGYSLNLWDV